MSGKVRLGGGRENCYAAVMLLVLVPNLTNQHKFRRPQMSCPEISYQVYSGGEGGGGVAINCFLALNDHELGILSWFFV